MRSDLETALVGCGISCSSQALEQLCRYYDLISQWNQHTNLTALTDPQAYIYKHICDSIYPLRFLEAVPDMMIDVGTGAGFPGLPIKIVRPEIKVHLLEAAAKRVDFLRYCCTNLGVDAEIHHARAEDYGRSSGRARYTLAVTRAVANLAVICEYCLPLVSIGGSFIAMKGPSSTEEIDDARNAIVILGGSIKAIHQYSLPSGDARSLVVIEKVQQTPDKYPRRPGIPAKKPL